MGRFKRDADIYTPEADGIDADGVDPRSYDEGDDGLADFIAEWQDYMGENQDNFNA